MWFVPWAVIDDQHTQYSENGDRNCGYQGCTAMAWRMAIL